MPRGGRRTGTPGQQYSNRSDLNQRRGPMAPTAAPGQTYGKAGAQIAAQRAVPMAPPPPPATGRPAGPVGAGAATAPAPTMPLPGGVVPLDAPTQRPNEPVTAGMAMGAGAGPEALGPLAGQSEDVGMQLRAIYSRFPNDDLRSLIELLDD